MIDTIDPKISAALDRLGDSVLNRSGSVFYTGREAFYGVRPLYLLGLNPGGSSVAQASNTVRRHLEAFAVREQPWSAYADDSWEGAKPGTWGMQPRVLHMLRQLGLDPRLVPASNLIFARTANEAALQNERQLLLQQCWPVHQAVIDALKVNTIVCFGGTAGLWTREALGAHSPVGSYRETNNRGWLSQAHVAPDGRAVVTVTHPGRADWRNPAADPTQLVRKVLERDLS